MAFAQRTDVVLLTVTLTLVAMGLVMVYSTSAVLAHELHDDSLYFLRRQLLWAGLGLLALGAARYFPYRGQRRLAMPLVGCTLLLLLLVLVPWIGKEVGGARRWLPVGPLTVQPSEIAKYVMLLAMARSLAKHQERLKSLAYGYMPNVVIVGAFAGLIFAEPDLGTAVVLTTTACLLLLVAGIPLRYLGLTALAGLPFLYWGVIHVRFRWERLLSFWNPWADPHGSGYQPIQSLVALGQGGWLGVGLGHGQQKLFYLPEAHTDFIFAMIGEEFGFLGATMMVALFGLLLWRILRIALACPEPFGIYLGLGVFLLLAIQITVNLGVVVGLLPTKGLPLPLISLGGSHLLVSLFAIGTMLNMAETGTHGVRT